MKHLPTLFSPPPVTPELAEVSDELKDVYEKFIDFGEKMKSMVKKIEKNEATAEYAALVDAAEIKAAEAVHSASNGEIPVYLVRLMLRSYCACISMTTVFNLVQEYIQSQKKGE